MDLIKHWKKHQSKDWSSFLASLKKTNKKQLISLADKAHDEVFQKLDCLDCANCCTSIPPLINSTDITRISKHLRLSKSDFMDKHVIVDEDGDMVLNQSPCSFLEPDNRCAIYEVRPKACREYPHTDGKQFTDNFSIHALNAKVCPAAFSVLEAINEAL